MGVIQEQHPERCRLFAQWQNFAWPIVHDPFNLMGNSAVPIAVAIDEHGVVRSTRPNPKTFEKEFLNVKFQAPSLKATTIGIPTDWQKLVGVAKRSERAEDLKTAADAMILWAGQEKLSDAISLYEQAAKNAPQDATLQFRLGVAYQMRHEASAGKLNDFANAIKSWRTALAMNPNQYIWRRRIQQYGPRLDKPYPFYDWVSTARNDIRQKGETPIELPVEPVGAELASRARSIMPQTTEKNPDPSGKITRDDAQLVAIQSVVVPNTSKPKTSSMVHLQFAVRDQVTWSNEAGPLEVWIEGRGVTQTKKHFRVSNRKKLESSEQRKVELEIIREPDAKTLRGFALYYVCEDSGTCKFLRQDFVVDLAGQ